MRDKLERARDLMMHANPNGDLAVVVERALDVLLDKLERQRLGKAERPRESTRETKPGTVRRAVRRQVFERDGARCTYVSADGARCPARARLELDHVVPRARGGNEEATNLRVRCRAHNQLYAEEVFGKEHVKGRIDFRRRKWDDGAELAKRGLVRLGFRSRDATRALGIVAERHKSDATPPPKETVLREALAVLA